MKIRNISSKVIGVEGIPLMPDQEIEVKSGVAEYPAIKALVSVGFLAVDDTEAKKAAEEAAAKKVAIEKAASDKAAAEKKAAEAKKAAESK